MQAKPGKTLRVDDSYKVVDSSNRSAFVLVGVCVLLSCGCSVVIKNNLAKPTYSKAHPASYSQLEQLLINLMSQNHLHYSKLLTCLLIITNLESQYNLHYL